MLPSHRFPFGRLPGSLRSVALVLVGMVAGLGLVAVHSVIGTADAASMQTHAASCSGYDFHTVDSATSFAYSSTLIYRVSGTDGGSGFFICDPMLPNKAVVTKVQITVHDSVLRSWLTGCGLYRVNETTTNTGAAQELASFPESSDTGDQRMVDTSILNATVDNTSYAYEIQCQIAGTDTSMYVGIYGATVTYKIGSTNG